MSIKTRTTTATIKHACTQQEIAVHLRSVEKAMRERSTTSWEGTHFARVSIPLSRSCIDGSVDAREPGVITLTVEGPSLVMAMWEAMAIRKIDGFVRDQLGEKHLGLESARR